MPEIPYINIATGDDGQTCYRLLMNKLSPGSYATRPIAIVFGSTYAEAEERGAVLGCAYDMLQLLEDLDTTGLDGGLLTPDYADRIHFLLKQIKEG